MGHRLRDAWTFVRRANSTEVKVLRDHQSTTTRDTHDSRGDQSQSRDQAANNKRLNNNPNLTHENTGGMSKDRKNNSNKSTRPSVARGEQEQEKSTKKSVEAVEEDEWYVHTFCFSPLKYTHTHTSTTSHPTPHLDTLYIYIYIST